MSMKSGPWRTREEGIRDREIIADLYLRGKTQRAIAEIISGLYPRTITQQTISNDLKVIREDWKKRASQSFNQYVENELIKIDHLEQTYWQAWERSCEPSKKTTQQVIRKGEADEGASNRATIETTEYAGDPRFLQGIEKCIARRMALLGLETRKAEVTVLDVTPADSVRERLAIKLAEMAARQPQQNGNST